LVLRRHQAGFLRVLLQPALEDVAILNPCAKSRVPKVQETTLLHMKFGKIYFGDSPMLASCYRV
jgi:hypothetical protein